MASTSVSFPLSTHFKNAAGSRMSSKASPFRLRHFSSRPRVSTNSNSAQPRAFSSAARLRPMNPAAPVTTIFLATLRLRLSVHLDNLLNHVGGRTALDHVSQNYLAAVGFDQFTSADVMRPVLSFDQDLWQNFRDDAFRLRVAEVDHIVHRTERGENIGAVLFVIDGAVVSLVRLD